MKYRKKKKPGMSSRQDGAGRSNEVVTSSTWKTGTGCLAGCPVVLVDETHIGFIILFVFVQESRYIFLYRPPSEVCLSPLESSVPYLTLP